ncbi:MAG: AAA family ATPase, partial [Bdellovibrio sp.]
MEITRAFVDQLLTSLSRKKPLIEVVIGPRQVGKTTGIKQLLKKIPYDHLYVSADGDILKSSSWITEQWLLAKSKSSHSLLVIDEIQKVENWAEAVKQ